LEPGQVKRWAAVSVDHSVCVGSANCTALAPHVFQLNAEGHSEVSTSGPVAVKLALLAAESCPVGAIQVRDAASGEMLTGAASVAPAHPPLERIGDESGEAPAIDDEMYGDEVIADPYTYYGRLRELDPVHWNARYETWLVTRYDDIVWLLRHPELFSSRFYADDVQPPSPPIDDEDFDEMAFVSRFRTHELIQNDPPDHRRMRVVINSFFTPSRMEQWREMVRSAVDSLLDQVAGGGGLDISADLGRPLPLRVISELLGIPEADRAALKEHADRRMLSALSLEPDRMRVAAGGIRDTSAYLAAGLDRDRWAGGERLMSIMAGAEGQGAYSRQEVLANAQLLIDAGHETTIQLICNGVLALMRNRGQWERFKQAPGELAWSATEECLRYDPPLPAPRRLAARAVRLRGKTIRKGQRVFYVLAAGNRDPRVFENPDRFQIDRNPNRHIAFGYGIHVCLGQYLARMEGQEVFKALAARMPDMRLTTDRIEYAKIRGVRSMLSLPVAGRLR
jgi:cytochrome P450/ferredoxin